MVPPRPVLADGRKHVDHDGRSESLDFVRRIGGHGDALTGGDDLLMVADHEAQPALENVRHLLFSAGAGARRHPPRARCARSSSSRCGASGGRLIVQLLDRLLVPSLDARRASLQGAVRTLSGIRPRIRGVPDDDRTDRIPPREGQRERCGHRVHRCRESSVSAEDVQSRSSTTRATRWPFCSATRRRHFRRRRGRGRNIALHERAKLVARIDFRPGRVPGSPALDRLAETVIRRRHRYDRGRRARDAALPLGLVDDKVCAIDGTWSQATGSFGAANAALRSGSGDTLAPRRPGPSQTRAVTRSPSASWQAWSAAAHGQAERDGVRQRDVRVVEQLRTPGRAANWAFSSCGNWKSGSSRLACQSPGAGAAGVDSRNASPNATTLVRSSAKALNRSCAPVTDVPNATRVTSKGAESTRLPRDTITDQPLGHAFAAPQSPIRPKPPKIAAAGRNSGTASTTTPTTGRGRSASSCASRSRQRARSGRPRQRRERNRLPPRLMLCLLRLVVCHPRRFAAGGPTPAGRGTAGERVDARNQGSARKRRYFDRCPCQRHIAAAGRTRRACAASSTRSIAPQSRSRRPSTRMPCSS